MPPTDTHYTTQAATPWGRVIELRTLEGSVIASAPLFDHEVEGRDRGVVTAYVIDGLRLAAGLGSF